MWMVLTVEEPATGHLHGFTDWGHRTQTERTGNLQIQVCLPQGK